MPCRLLRLAAATALLLAAGTLQARPAWFGEDDRIRVGYTPRVLHWNDRDDYVDWNHIVAVEYITPRYLFWRADRSHFGAAVFDNSYGQFSQTVYYGLEWSWKQAWGGELFWAVSAGLVHGYKEPYENRLPLNRALGVGLTIVPALGWEREGIGFALSMSGSAVALRASWKFGAP
ncbi:MAG: hypothetical protein PVI87_09905 [Gammaproteobacteria bacterium]